MFKPLTYSKDHFAMVVNNRLNGGEYFFEKKFGDTRTLNDGKKDVAFLKRNKNFEKGNLTDRQFANFIANFNKKVYRAFADNNDLYDLKIDYKGQTTNVKREFYRNLKGKYFYELDIQNAYWKTLHILGYIDKKFYDDYKWLDDYKMAKRLCVSFLAREKKCVYHHEGNEYTIKCDAEILKQVFTNVQNHCKNFIAEIRDAINQDYYYFTIDSICVTSKNVDKVIEVYKKHGYAHTLTQCVKIDEETYKHGRKIKSVK